MSFFWCCAKAYPILDLVPGFLLSSVIPLNQLAAAFRQAHGVQTHRSYINGMGCNPTESVQFSAVDYLPSS